MNDKTPNLLEPLNPLSAAFAGADGNGKYPCVILIACLIRGDLDIDALQAAFRRAIDSNPKMMSGVAEHFSNGKFELFWEPRPQFKPPLLISEMHLKDTSLDRFSLTVDHLRPNLERGFNLFDGVAAEFHLLRLSHDEHILAALMHHAAFDAETGSQVLLGILGHYHEIAEGLSPPWNKKRGALSSSRSRRIPCPKGGFRKTLSALLKLVQPWNRDDTLPVGNGERQSADYYCCRRILPAKEALSVKTASQRSDVAFIDRAVAGAHLAVDRWNREHNAASSRIRVTISMNVRDRFRGIGRHNSLVSLLFQSIAAERRDPSDLLRVIGRERMKQIRSRTDYSLYSLQRSIRNLLGIFPRKVNARVAEFLLQGLKLYASAIQIHYLGTALPGLKGEELDEDSHDYRLGNLRVSDVYGFAYKMPLWTPINVWLYQYGKALNLVVGAWGWLFTDREAEAFTDILADRLLNYPA